MTNIQPAPPAKSTDALNRAARTFLQGLGVTIVAALVTVLVASVSDIQWTGTYWKALGLAAANSVLVAVVSYVARYVAPPKP